MWTEKGACHFVRHVLGVFESDWARGHETCTYDEHNISKNVYLISVSLSRSVDRKHLQGLESDFLSVPSFYISFYDYSKLTPGQ